MSDPCSGELVCLYEVKAGLPCSYFPNGWPRRATCVSGRWQVRYVSHGVCNPPPPCPADDPYLTPTACWSTPGGPQIDCRYARATCFVYTSCAFEAGWTSSPSAALVADSCCPASPPAIGEACSEPALACAYGSTDNENVVCRDGTWEKRKPLGSAGAAGSAGASASGSAGTNGWAGASGTAAASASGAAGAEP